MIPDNPLPPNSPIRSLLLALVVVACSAPPVDDETSEITAQAYAAPEVDGSSTAGQPETQPGDDPHVEPSSPPAGGAPPSTAPADAVAALRHSLAGLLPADQATSVVVDHVRLTGSPVAGPLAEHLHGLLGEAVGALPGVILVSQHSRDEILALLVTWWSDAYDLDSLPELGLLRGATHLLRSAFVELGAPPRVRLSLELVSIETGTATVASVELPRASLPAGLGAEPTNQQRIAATLEAWAAEVPRSAFPLELWTDRGIGASYAPGEALRVFVRSGRAGTVALEWLDAAGRSERFFPNVLHDDNRVGARGVLEIPDDTMAFALTVSEGEGSEVLRAVVTADDGTRAQALCGFRIVP